MGRRKGQHHAATSTSAGGVSACSAASETTQTGSSAPTTSQTSSPNSGESNGHTQHTVTTTENEKTGAMKRREQLRHRYEAKLRGTREKRLGHKGAATSDVSADPARTTNMVGNSGKEYGTEYLALAACQAIITGDKSSLQASLMFGKLNPNVNSPSIDPWNGRPLLHLAIQFSRPELVRVLLTYRADSAAIHEAGKGLKHNALTYAVSRGEAEIAKILLENGANANDAEGSLSLSPLHIAAQHKDEAQGLRLAKILLYYGADPRTVDNGMTPTLTRVRYASVAKLLLDAGADLHAASDKFITPFIYAAYRAAKKQADCEEAERILDLFEANGVLDIERIYECLFLISVTLLQAKTKWAVSLHYLHRQSQVEKSGLMEYLCTRFSKTNFEQCKQKVTVAQEDLMEAVTEGNSAVVLHCLYTMNDDPNAYDLNVRYSTGETITYRALMSGNVSICTFLGLALHIDFTAKSVNGSDDETTIAHHMCYHIWDSDSTNARSLLGGLLEQNKVPELSQLRDCNGRDPWLYAVHMSKQARNLLPLDFILDTCPEICKHKDKSGNTLLLELMSAERKWDLGRGLFAAVIETLCKEGASVDTDVVDEDNLSVLQRLIKVAGEQFKNIKDYLVEYHSVEVEKTYERNNRIHQSLDEIQKAQQEGTWGGAQLDEIVFSKEYDAMESKEKLEEVIEKDLQSLRNAVIQEHVRCCVAILKRAMDIESLVMHKPDDGDMDTIHFAIRTAPWCAIPILNHWPAWTIRDEDGNTPLHTALIQDNKELFCTLLQSLSRYPRYAKEIKDIQNNEGHTVDDLLEKKVEEYKDSLEDTSQESTAAQSAETATNSTSTTAQSVSTSSNDTELATSTTTATTAASEVKNSATMNANLVVYAQQYWQKLLSA